MMRHKYSITLALNGIDAEANTDFVGAFASELELWNWIETPKIEWDEDGHRLVVHLVTEGDDGLSTARLMAEQLFELSPAMLTNPAGIYVKVLRVREVGPD